jgi:hypothetical protein
MVSNALQTMMMLYVPRVVYIGYVDCVGVEIWGGTGGGGGRYNVFPLPTAVEREI